MKFTVTLSKVLSIRHIKFDKWTRSPFCVIYKTIFQHLPTSHISNIHIFEILVFDIWFIQIWFISETVRRHKSKMCVDILVILAVDIYKIPPVVFFYKRCCRVKEFYKHGLRWRTTLFCLLDHEIITISIVDDLFEGFFIQK